MILFNFKKNNLFCNYGPCSYINPFPIIVNSDISIYINLRRSRDGMVFVPSFLRVFVCYPRFIQFASATCYAVHINALSI